MTDEPSTPDWEGSRLELDVGAVAHGGHCVARYEGRVVFVRHALPGERVIAEVTEDRGGSFCRADAVRILTPAAGRVEPPCRYARPGGCGGCDWQHASGPVQRELKAAVVTEQLARLAGLDRQVHVEELPGGLLGWRTRVRLATDRRGRPGFRGHRDHGLVPVEECPISAPGLLDEVLTRTWTPGAEVLATLDAEQAVHVSESRPLPGRRQTTARVLGEGRAVQHAAGHRWLLRAHNFWQVHPAAAETLAGVVGEWATASPGACAWDLYSGAGLFSVVLAGQVGPRGDVLAVDSARQTGADFEANLGALPQVRFRAGTVHRVLADEDSRPEVVVLDPSRKGAGKAVVDAISERRPSTVVYVACDPAALARDIANFGEHGYRLTDLRAFDAFPMTHHLECVARLVR